MTTRRFTRNNLPSLPPPQCHAPLPPDPFPPQWPGQPLYAWCTCSPPPTKPDPRQAWSYFTLPRTADPDSYEGDDHGAASTWILQYTLARDRLSGQLDAIIRPTLEGETELIFPADTLNPPQHLLLHFEFVTIDPAGYLITIRIHN